MNEYSTVQVAKKLGMTRMTLYRYIRAKKIPVPKMRKLFGLRVRVWTERDIEAIRALLPKIKNGRKTRYQKQKKETKKNKP